MRQIYVHGSFKCCIRLIYPIPVVAASTQFIHNSGIELHRDIGVFIKRRAVETPDFTGFMDLHGVMGTYEILSASSDA